MHTTQALVDGLKQTEPAGSRVPEFAACTQDVIESGVALGLGQFPEAAAAGAAAAQRVQDLEPNAAFEGFLKYTAWCSVR